MSQRYFLAPTSQFYFCGIPFRLDVSRQCTFNCQYCFSSLRRGDRNLSQTYFEIKTLEKRLNNPSSSSVVSELISNRMPIHFGGMSDPFSTEQSTDCSRKILKALNDHLYPVVISTKNPYALLDTDRLRGETNIVQVSFSVYNPSLARILEPNAPLPDDRIKVMVDLKSRGYTICARLQPYIPQFKDDVIFELLPRLVEAGVEHLVLEHLKIPIEQSSRNALFQILRRLGIRQDDFFKYGKTYIGREISICADEKYDSIQFIKEICVANGITFGAGDYGFYHFSTTNCCCGIDKYVNFDNWFRGNFTNVIKESSGVITKDALDKYEYPNGSIRMYINSHSRQQNNSVKIKDFLLRKWNQPGTTNSLDSYYGVKALEEIDSEGYTIYYKTRIGEGKYV